MNIKHRYFNVGNYMMYGNHKTEKEAYDNKVHQDDKYICKVTFVDGKPLAIDIVHEYKTTRKERG